MHKLHEEITLGNEYVTHCKERMSHIAPNWVTEKTVVSYQPTYQHNNYPAFTIKQTHVLVQQFVGHLDTTFTYPLPINEFLLALPLLFGEDVDQDVEDLLLDRIKESMYPDVPDFLRLIP